MKTFECEICSAAYAEKKEADACCREQKIPRICRACGKSHANKKEAIHCCTSAKKNFLKA